MIILTIRTDKPVAEVGLYDGEMQLAYETWEAHRQLSVTIHQKIDEVLKRSGKSLHDVQGIACFQGPGSFTGLRIGLTLANTLAYALNIPIAGRPDPRWLETGIADLVAGKNDTLALPNYGAEAHITQQKK